MTLPTPAPLNVRWFRCLVPGCEHVHYARGWCVYHYAVAHPTAAA